MRRGWLLLVGCCLLAPGRPGYLATLHVGRPPVPGDGSRPATSSGDVELVSVPGSSDAKGRVVSWDVGFRPGDGERVDRSRRREVRDSVAAEVDVLVFPELFAAGLGPYAPEGDRPPSSSPGGCTTRCFPR